MATVAKAERPKDRRANGASPQDQVRSDPVGRAADRVALGADGADGRPASRAALPSQSLDCDSPGSVALVRTRSGYQHAFHHTRLWLSSFNGATVYPPWKVRLSSPMNKSHLRFNGATIFVSWKESLKGFALELNPQQLLQVRLTGIYRSALPVRDISVG